MNFKAPKISGWIHGGILSLLFCFTNACGSKRATQSQEAPGLAKTASAFALSSKKYHLPPRIIMAVAYLESQIKSSRSYASNGIGMMGLSLAESAFGISRKELEIPDDENGDEIGLQIDAYSQWLSKKLSSIDLPEDPKTSEEKFLWLWEIAQHHRQGALGRKNVRIFFAKELMRILNQGFTWQDANSKETIRFEKENPVIKTEELSQISQSLLKLSTRRAQIPSAMFFPLIESEPETHLSGDQRPIPSGIEIIHCPFSLSACVELQHKTRNDGSTVGPFDVHYIIPQDSELTDYPLQLSLHEDAISTEINESKSPSYKIMIMLSGYSGRLIAGARQHIYPMWLSKWQLARMGELVIDICHKLIADYGNRYPFSLSECSEESKGVHFRTQDKNSPIRWGDILDFDERIFSTYLHAPEGLAGETAFQFSSKELTYTAGTPIRFELMFQPRVQYVEIERLVRCSSERAVWAPVGTTDVRSQVKLPFEKFLWDSGPNANGEQFFKAKVYNNEGQLLGWDVGQIYLQKYETTKPSLNYTACM